VWWYTPAILDRREVEVGVRSEANLGKNKTLAEI
jgi:hypothetical protein